MDVGDALGEQGNRVEQGVDALIRRQDAEEHDDALAGETETADRSGSRGTRRKTLRSTPSGRALHASGRSDSFRRRARRGFRAHETTSGRLASQCSTRLDTARETDRDG